MKRGNHFKGGRITKSNGYVYVWEPTHPLAHREGYVAEHRKVAWDTFGPFPKHLHVHHINGDKHDNRPENLEVIDQSAHTLHHLEATGVVTNQFGTFPVARDVEARRARWREHNRRATEKYLATVEPVPCPVCGEMFKPKRKQTFCSVACGAIGQRRNGGRKKKAA